MVSFGGSFMTKPILVFQHVAHEHLGELAPTLKQEGLVPTYIRSYQDDLWDVDWEHLGHPEGLIIMGGPQSANDDLPYLRHELRLIETALRLEKPILGICLGSQLIVKALGARVYPGDRKEIGWYDLQLNDAAKEDPLFAEWPALGPMFQWHGETFDLPRNAQCLAASDLYPHQAYRYGDRVYGLQFHPEMTLEMVTQWLQLGHDEIESAALPQSSEEILAAAPQQLKKISPLVQQLAKAWAGLLG